MEFSTLFDLRHVRLLPFYFFSLSKNEYRTGQDRGQDRDAGRGRDGRVALCDGVKVRGGGQGEGLRGWSLATNITWEILIGVQGEPLAGIGFVSQAETDLREGPWLSKSSKEDAIALFVFTSHKSDLHRRNYMRPHQNDPCRSLQACKGSLLKSLCALYALLD